MKYYQCVTFLALKFLHRHHSIGYLRYDLEVSVKTITFSSKNFIVVRGYCWAGGYNMTPV